MQWENCQCHLLWGAFAWACSASLALLNYICITYYVIWCTNAMKAKKYDIYNWRIKSLLANPFSVYPSSELF